MLDALVSSADRFTAARDDDDPVPARLVAGVLYAVFVPLAVALEYREGAFSSRPGAALLVTAALVAQLVLVIVVPRITEPIGLLLVIAVPASYLGYGLIQSEATDRLAPCLVLPVLWTALFLPARLALLSVLLNGAVGAYVEWRAVDPGQLGLVAGVRLGVYATAAVIVASLVNGIRRQRDEFRSASRTLQETLVPAELPEVAGVALAAAYRPAMAKYLIGGDFYDAFPYQGAGVVVWVGDVAGKGLEAGAAAALVRHRLRSGAAMGRPLLRMVEDANDALLGRTDGRHATLAAALLRPDGPGFSAEIVRAGHPPPILVSGGAAESLLPAGEALGIRERPELEVAELRLGAGDALLLYTDGVTEARRGGAFYGEGRLLDAVAEMPTANPTAICEAILGDVSAFTTDLRDDIALLAVGVRP